VSIPLTDLAGELSLKVRGGRATVRREGRTIDFDVTRVPQLTASEARGVRAGDPAGRPPLVVFDEASAEAREELRRRRVSYASTRGELFLCTADILVDRPAASSEHAPARAFDDRAHGEVWPFAKRAARVTRWLLLKPDESPTIGELAASTDLSRPFTSQVVGSLADRALVETSPERTRVCGESVSSTPGRCSMPGLRNGSGGAGGR
jgi:hypothetical protein